MPDDKDPPGVERSNPPERLQVTPAMIEAGVREFRKHPLGANPAHLVECIYRAMQPFSPGPPPPPPGPK